MRVDTIDIKINNHELVLRNPEQGDAEMLLEYLKTTCGETRFLVKEPEEITMTLEDERDFINIQNKSQRNLMLLGFLDWEYVGNCSLMGMSPSRYQHRVSMGDCFISEIYWNGNWKGNDRTAYQYIKRKRN